MVNRPAVVTWPVAFLDSVNQRCWNSKLGKRLDTRLSYLFWDIFHGNTESLTRRILFGFTLPLFFEVFLG